MSEQTTGLEFQEVGATLRDALVWKDAKPGDEGVQQAVVDIQTTLDKWRAGELDSISALYELYDHCYRTEPKVSEDTSAMYIQAATFGFGFEAGISFEEDQRIHDLVRARHGIVDL